MKKLLLLALLLIGMMGFAQKEQFVRDYSQVLPTNKEGKSTGWKEISSRFFFNYGGDTTKVKVYVGDIAINFSQEGATERDVTEGGFGYQRMILIDDESLDMVLLQYFDLQEYGVRLIFTDGSSIQFTN
jgi:hypothetical protein